MYKGLLIHSLLCSKFVELTLNKVESYCMQQQKALQGGDINALHYSNLLTKIKRIRKQYEKAE